MPNYQNNMCGRTAGSQNSRHGVPAHGTGIHSSCGTAMRRPGPQQSAAPSCRRSPEGSARVDGLLKGAAIAMAYVPWQQWQNVYEICRGFERGTIFEDLDKPFSGKGGCR